MKPTTALALRLLRENESVTTHQFLAEGVGSRFGARLLELRELGYTITGQRLTGGVRGSRYRLVGLPEEEREEDELRDYDPTQEGGGGPCERCGYEQEPWRFSRLCQACLWDDAAPPPRETTPTALFDPDALAA